MSNEQTYSVIYTDEAVASLSLIQGDKVFSAILNAIRLLETSPHLGHIYDPDYPASNPPFECRVMHCERHAIYHVVHDDDGKVIVFAIEDNRRNPMALFRDVNYAFIELDSEEQE